MKRLNLLLTTLLATVFAVNVQAVALSDLLAGGELQVEDKLFHDFQLILQLDPSTGAAIDLSNIEVTGLASDPGQNNQGLRFDALNGALSIFGGDPDGDELLLWFGYSVTVLDPGMAIVGVEMELTGFDVSAANEGLVWVDKFIDPTLDQLDVVVDQVGQVGLPGMQLNDAVGFGPMGSIFVDDLIVVSGAEGDMVALTSWEQRFLQRGVDMPIPGTLALIGLGLLALARRRRT